MATRPKATIKDLYHLPKDGKAEIVNGELIARAPTGFLPGRAAGAIYLSLREYERSTEVGFAFPDNTQASRSSYLIANRSALIAPFIPASPRA
jgi:hypothetical protein